MYSIFSVAESVGSNSTTPLCSPYFIPSAIAFFTNSFSFFSFFISKEQDSMGQVLRRSRILRRIPMVCECRAGNQQDVGCKDGIMKREPNAGRTSVQIQPIRFHSQIEGRPGSVTVPGNQTLSVRASGTALKHSRNYSIDKNYFCCTSNLIPGVSWLMFHTSKLINNRTAPNLFLCLF
jgi:hypothetical protein